MKKLSALIPREQTDELMRTLQRLRCVGIERLVSDGDAADPTAGEALCAAVPDGAGDAAPVPAKDGAGNAGGTAAVTQEGAKKPAADDEVLASFILPDSIATAAGLAEYDVSADIARMEEKRSQLTAAIAFLGEHFTAKHPLFHDPEVIGIEKFEDERLAGADDALERAARIMNDLSSAKRTAAELLSQIDSLTPFEPVDIPLPTFSTEYTESVCGTVPVSCDTAALDAALAEHACVFETVSESRVCRGAILTAYREELADCMAIASSFGFVTATAEAKASEGYARGRLNKAKSELATCRAIADGKKAEAEKCANESLGELRTYLDYVDTTLARLTESTKLRQTESCTVIGAYVPEKAAAKVTALLDGMNAAWELSEVDGEREDVPVLLSNGALGSQFEPIVGLYSMPKYGTFDPSLIMSFFYILIFGLMFADVGYGLTLTLGCILGLRLMHPKPGLKKFLTMFAVCGVASMVGGALFGGYFGDLPARIMEDFFGVTKAPDMALAFNMIDEPISFLIVSLAMGALHLLCGMAIRFILLWKDGKIFEAVFDVGSWFVLFAGIALAVAVNSSVGIALCIAGVLMLVATQGREAKNPVMRVLKGIMSLYDLISYASDLLSYSRILALSLASAVIANVVNIFGTMGGPGIGGVISLILAFAIGHTLNFAVNILGTYVHTSRLQYIEFFGKFYESGGREFTPLAPESRYALFN